MVVELEIREDNETFNVDDLSIHGLTHIKFRAETIINEINKELERLKEV